MSVICRLSWVSLWLLVAAISPALSGCDRSAPGSQPPSTVPATTTAPARPGQGPPAREIPVTTALAERGDVDRVVEEIGNAVAIDDVAIRAQAEGTLLEVRVKDGQAVKKGDVLFVLDARPFEAALNEAKAIAAATQADLASAQRDLQRLMRLPPGASSAQDVDTAQSAVDRLTAQTAVNEAKIRTAEINLSYTTIRAPVDGILGRVLVTQGNLVMAGMSVGPLAQLRSIHPIYVDFTTPEQNLEAVRAAMNGSGGGTTFASPTDASSATSGAVVEVRVDGSPVLSRGRLTFIDNQVQSDVGLVQLRATIPNPDRLLWPGRFVRVRLILSKDRNVTLVPAEAIDEGEGGPRAYLVRPDNTIQLIRPVLGQRQRASSTTAPPTPERIVILSGISPGDRLVIKGRWLLRPDSKVKIVDETPTPTSPQPPPQSPR